MCPELQGEDCHYEWWHDHPHAQQHIELCDTSTRGEPHVNFHDINQLILMQNIVLPSNKGMWLV